jgi:hypothetical protein
MAKIIEAKALITADNRTRPAFAQIAKDVMALEKAMATMAKGNGVSRLAAQVEQASRAYARASRDAERFASASRAAAAGSSMANTVRAVDSATRAMERATKAARDMQTASGNAMKLKVDTRDLERALKMQERLARSTGSGNPAGPRAPRQPAPPAAPFGHRPAGFTPSLPGMPAADGRNAARQGFDQAASLPQVQALMRMRGESEDNIKRATDEAVKLSKDVKQFSIAEHLQSIYQMLAIFGDMDKSIANAPRVARMNALVEGLQDKFVGLKPYAGGTLTKDLARIFDSLGVTEDPKRMNEIGEAVIKGITSSSGDITPSDYLMALKYARIGKYGYSTDFLQNYMPGIIGDAKTRTGGASSAGTGLAAMSDQFADLRATDAAKEQMVRLGLIEGQFQRSSDGNGKIKGRGTANVKNVEMLRSNPQQWATQTLLPLIEAKYGKLTGDPEKDARTVSEALGLITSNRVAKDTLGGMIIQRDERERDARITRGMPGLAALDVLDRDAPVSALQGLTAASKDFLGTVAGPMVGPAVAGMQGMTDAIRRFTTWAHDNPEQGKAAGLAIGAGAAGVAATGAWAARQWWRGPTVPPGTVPPTSLPPAGLVPPPATGPATAAAQAAARIPQFARFGATGAVIGAGAVGIGIIGDANRQLYKDHDPTTPHNQGRNRRRAFHDSLRDDTRRLRETHAPDMERITPTQAPDRMSNIKATVDQPIPVNVTGKLDPVELKGQGQVNVTVKVAGPGQVTGMSSSSSGHIRVDAGTALAEFGQ